MKKKSKKFYLQISIIKKVLDLDFLKLWLAKVIQNLKQDSNRMQENISNIY